VSLWDELHVPLYHRSRFYGGKANSYLRCNQPLLRMELKRLMWLRDVMDKDKSLKVRAKGDLVREKEELMEKLKQIRRSIRDSMFTAWGFRRDDKRRKQRIIRDIWAPNQDCAKSAAIVLLLDEGCLDRKTFFMHFSSFYLGF